MNTLTLKRRQFSTRIFAVLAILPLLLTAFTAAFFVAEAQEPTVPLGEPTTEMPLIEDEDKTVLLKVIETKIDICHWNGQVFNLLNVSVSSIGNAHGSQGVNDGDIIPVFADYAGQNLAETYGDQTGAEVLANNCVIDKDEEAKIKVFKWIVGEETGPAALSDFSFQIDDDDPIGFNQLGFGYDYVPTGETYEINEANTPEDYAHLKTICKVIDWDHDQRDREDSLGPEVQVVPQQLELGWEEHIHSNLVTLEDKDDLGVCLIINTYDPAPDDPEYGPYCGDGELNQRWEQCDSGHLLNEAGPQRVGCSEQCQYVTGPVCTDLTLAKIGIENVENKEGGIGNMTDNIYLGGNTPIPNQAWFLLHWNGVYANDADVSNYEDVPGLAVERAEGEVRSVMYGTNTAADEEHVDGMIEFWSWNGSVEATALRSDNSNDLPGNNKLEGDWTDGSGIGSTNAGDDEVWLDSGDSHFWLTTTSADDGFYTEYSDPAECAVCEADVNLIENGGFESPILSANSWDVFYSGEPLLAWLTGENGIEIQNNVAGSPYAGNQHAELDPYNPTIIWQEIETIPGETYKLSTYYSPRPGRDAEDNRFEFRVDGSALGSSIAPDGTGNQDTVWTLEEREFVATGPTTSVGFAEIGTDTSFGIYLDEVALMCVPDPEPDPEVTIVAHKIVCTDESELPNDADGSLLRPISSTTAQEWVDGHDSCDFAEGWEFEWGPQSSFDPGDTATGAAGEPWVTFGPTDSLGMAAVAVTEEELGDDTHLWFREVLQNGYIPFTHDQNGNTNADDVTAEVYCSTDVKNYDNYDRIDGVELDETYHCVSWNVPTETPPVDVCENLEGDQSELPEGYEFVDEGICMPIEEEVLGCTDEAALNYNSAATPGNEDAEACEYEEEDKRHNSSSGTRVKKPAPQVAGAATTNYCPLLTDHMQMGWQNDRLEVMKLQMFLNTFRNTYGGVENPVTGNFGVITDANVKAFQEQYHDEVINPWYERGIVSHHEPTGFVYKTTLWKINSIVCPDYAVQPSFEGENLRSNVDLHVQPISD